MVADYSQIEVRVAALASGDAVLLRLIEGDDDIHRAMAAEMLGKAPEDVTKAERHYLTKTVKVPAVKTVFGPVTKIVRREVPYEVECVVEK